MHQDWFVCLYLVFKDGAQQQCSSIVYRKLCPHLVVFTFFLWNKIVVLGMTCEWVQPTETGPYWPVQAACAFTRTRFSHSPWKKTKTNGYHKKYQFNTCWRITGDGINISIWSSVISKSQGLHVLDKYAIINVPLWCYTDVPVYKSYSADTREHDCLLQAPTTTTLSFSCIFCQWKMGCENYVTNIMTHFAIFVTIWLFCVLLSHFMPIFIYTLARIQNMLKSWVYESIHLCVNKSAFITIFDT